MDVWEKRQERVEEQGGGEGGGEPGNGIRGATGGGNVAVGPNSGAIVNIGNNNTAATTVNLGNTGTSAFGTVNVGRGATAVNIGDNVSSAITLGRTGGSVTLGPPLTLGAAPSSSTQLGGIFNGTFVAYTSPGNIYSLALTTGSWIIFATAYFPGVTNFAALYISAISSTADNYGGSTIPGNGGIGFSISRGVNITSANQTWYVVANSGSTITTQFVGAYAIRVG